MTALHPEHAGDVAAYDNALRQRSRLLADGGRDPHWFTALEDTMARHGVALAAARADTVHRLDAAARLGVGPFPRAALAMAGEIDDWLATMPALDAEDRLRAQLAAGRLRDAEAGTTSCGPHRSDLAVRHLDLDLPAAEGSTGQQKAVLVSIALAHARLVALSRGRPPLLLLDEIAAHLDAERRRGAVRRGRGARRAELDDRHRCRTLCAARRPRADPARDRRLDRGGLNPFREART